MLENYVYSAWLCIISHSQPHTRIHTECCCSQLSVCTLLHGGLPADKWPGGEVQGESCQSQSALCCCSNLRCEGEGQKETQREMFTKYILKKFKKDSNSLESMQRKRNITAMKAKDTEGSVITTHDVLHSGLSVSYQVKWIFLGANQCAIEKPSTPA